MTCLECRYFQRISPPNGDRYHGYCLNAIRAQLEPRPRAEVGTDFALIRQNCNGFAAPNGGAK